MNEIEGALDSDSKDGDRTNLESEAATSYCIGVNKVLKWVGQHLV
jgi:hypothetical protein